MKVNFYLDYPKHSYYEIHVNPHKDSPTSIIASIFQKLYPPHMHTYSTSTPEFIHVREGTVLDHSCLMFLSNLWIGRTHNNSRLPVVLAGGLGGTLKTGRALNYMQAGDENRRMQSLYLSLMDRYDLKLDSFGGTSERLANL